MRLILRLSLDRYYFVLDSLHWAQEVAGQAQVVRRPLEELRLRRISNLLWVLSGRLLASLSLIARLFLCRLAERPEHEAVNIRSP